MGTGCTLAWAEAGASSSISYCSRTASPKNPPLKSSKKSLQNHYKFKSTTLHFPRIPPHVDKTSYRAQWQTGEKTPGEKIQIWAAKSFKSYCQSLKPPVEIQGLHNTLVLRVQESNLFSNLLHFSTNVIVSVALKDGEIFLWHLL